MADERGEEFISTAFSHDRGWSIFWDGNKWLYEDTEQPASGIRPCVNCGKEPTSEGYDACLGYIEGAFSACCGHGGREDKYIMWTGIRGWAQQIGIFIYNLYQQWVAIKPKIM